jgi:hypothetical protein
VKSTQPAEKKTLTVPLSGSTFALSHRNFSITSVIQRYSFNPYPVSLSSSLYDIIRLIIYSVEEALRSERFRDARI